MTTATATGLYAKRIAAADWDSVARELDAYGCALLPRLLTPAECARIAGLYDQPGHFRATIDMARHRFGEGQYRYFAAPHDGRVHCSSDGGRSWEALAIEWPDRYEAREGNALLVTAAA